MRIDEANRILGLRVNVWTSVLVGVGALAYLVVSAAAPGPVVRPDSAVPIGWLSLPKPIVG